LPLLTTVGVRLPSENSACRCNRHSVNLRRNNNNFNNKDTKTPTSPPSMLKWFVASG
jgi:hypothetical protein